MRILLCIVVMLSGQLNPQMGKPVVHLGVHQDVINVTFGGKLLELANAPPVVHLPVVPPKQDDAGNPWTIDIKNLGPNAVTVTGKGEFSVRDAVGQTLHIDSDGSSYRLKR